MCLLKYCCCWLSDEEKEDIDQDLSELAVPIVNKPKNRAKVVQAIYDYRGAYCPEGDLAFEKDECLEVLEDDGQWLLVENKSGTMGRVPSNYVELAYDKKWYFDDVKSRLEAEILLNHNSNPKQSFLVRKAHKVVGKHTHSLSVLIDDDKFDHYRIFSKNNTFYTKNGPKFTTLFKLIEHYQAKGFIKEPCSREPLLPCIDSSDFDQDDLIAPESIELVRKLGQGISGAVYQGLWNKNTVAIKLIKDPIELSELKKEAAILKKCIHKNIVTMYGICLKDTMMIVQEYMSSGSVKDLLKRKKANLEVPLTYQKLQYIGYQVACGMEYLERKNYIHNDIAARNILISLDRNPVVVKIADFGLARCLVQPVYLKKSKDQLPIRWCAPEVLNAYRMSIKSDVWSYGIFLMELFTEARLPYHNIIRNDEVIEQVCDGVIMNCPVEFNITKEDFKVMRSCWAMQPTKRPSFKKLVEYFEQ